MVYEKYYELIISMKALLTQVLCSFYSSFASDVFMHGQRDFPAP